MTDDYATIREQAMLDRVADPRQVVYTADERIAALEAGVAIALEHSKQSLDLLRAERRKTTDEKNRRRRDVRKVTTERDKALDRAEAAEQRVRDLEDKYEPR